MKGAVALLIGLFPLYGCMNAGEAGQDIAAPPAATVGAEAPTARAVSVADQPHTHTIRQDTHLVVEQDVTLMPRRTGIVEEIRVDRGDRVARGDLLLQLKNLDLQLYLKRAQIDLQRRQQEWDRARQLHDQNLIPDSDFDATRLDFDAAGVEVGIAGEELEKSLVRAPFDGQITDRFVRIGQKVFEDFDTPLLRITGVAALEVRLYLTEEVARRLAPDHPAEIRARTAAARPGAPAATGRVKYLSPVVDSGSGDVLVIVSLDHTDRTGPLRPGAAVSVTLEVPDCDGDIAVPRAAFAAGFQPARGEPAVIEVMEQGRPVQRRVVLGEMHGPWVGIRQGMRVDEWVVLQSSGIEAGKSTSAESAGKSDGTD